MLSGARGGRQGGLDRASEERHARARAGRLVQLLPQYRAEALGIHALYGSRRQMLPALRALLDFLAARLQGDPHWEEQLAP